jgi:hypothetical protein
MLNDFTYARYKMLCRELVQAGYASIPFSNHPLADPVAQQRILLLRHDVDYSLRKAEKIARIEKGFGIRSTFFIRLRKGMKAERIRQLAALGHEIGYHYDCCPAAGGQEGSFMKFRDDLGSLREHAEVRLASPHSHSVRLFHASGEFRALFAENGILMDVMHEIDYSAYHYYTDAGRSWSPRRRKICDRAPDFPAGYISVRSAGELALAIRDHKPRLLYISSHPELWAGNLASDIGLSLRYGGPRFLVKKIALLFRHRR